MTDVIHFDSIYSQYVLPQNDPFNSRYYLANSLNGVSKIYLKSLEMPINFCNVRSNSTLCKLTLLTNLGQYTVSIPQANYTTISALLTAINSAFANVIPSTTVNFTVNGYTVSCTLTSSTVTSFSFVDTLLSVYILGFRSPTYTGLVSNAPVNYLLNADNYIIMYLANVSADNTNNNGKLLCSFKIPLNAVNGVVYYQAENSSMIQGVNLLGSGQVLNYLQVVVYDRFGNQILSNNSDYSFSLGIQY